MEHWKKKILSNHLIFDVLVSEYQNYREKSLWDLKKNHTKEIKVLNSCKQMSYIYSLSSDASSTAV